MVTEGDLVVMVTEGDLGSGHRWVALWPVAKVTEGDLVAKVTDG